MLSRLALFAGLSLVACHESLPNAPTADAGPADEGADAAPWGCGASDFAGAPLGVRCGAFVDPAGHTVLLHGVNARVPGVFDVTFSDGRTALEPLPPFTAAEAKQARSMGFNALRLPINWSAVEPTETGGFDDGYLSAVAATVDAARAAGLLVLIDLHQDAYSKEIGEDGAPLWAIVPAPTKVLGGPLTNLVTRRLSKQVTDAFATFFGDSADGVRLRDRYAAMLAHVAARFADDAAVIGFELYNEPVADDATLVADWKPMIAAVRAAAPRKLVFFEPSVARNMNDQAPLGSGSLGAGTVYAPHVYTYSFSSAPATLTKDQLRPSNQAARAEADSFAAPLAITEYGFDPHSPSFATYLRFQHELQDETMASSFLWVYAELAQGKWGFFDYDASGAPTARQAAIDAFKRVRLESAAGRLQSVAYDADTKRFEAHVDGTGTTDDANVISIGGTFGAYDATCDGTPLAPQFTPGASDPVTLHCGGSGAHVLVVQGR